MIDPSSLRDADDVESLARWLYGGADLASRRGVVHVCALHAPGDGTLRNVRVGADSPKSPYDRFALDLARARADAIFITGKILRDEPTLRYAMPPALKAWRARVGHQAPPQLVVLTRGEGVDLSHPALTSEDVRPVLFTSAEAAAALRAQGDPHFTIVGHGEPSLGAAIAWARSEGARTLVLEAGPSTVRPLYDEGAIDELALSVFRGPVVEACRGATVFTEAELTAAMGTRTPPRVVDGDGGTWELQLFPARRA
ncbi:MAG: dihydrofolate reductase family protein [Myxococcales bacterium]|nr:dihydrofolate reductase family protein [Myxococcales bacterium]